MPLEKYDSNGNLIRPPDIVGTVTSPQSSVTPPTKLERYDNSGSLIHQIFNPSTSGVVNVFPKEQEISTPKDIGRNILKTLSPSITSLGMAAGAAPFTGGASLFAPAAGTVLGGLAAHFATQKALEGFGEQPEQDPWTSAATDVGLQQGGGMLVNKMGSLFKGLIRPPTYESISPEMQRLGPIYQEMIDKGGGPSYAQQNTGKIKKVLEDVFGGQAKSEQLKNAATASEAVDIGKVNQITGKSLTGFEDPQDVLKAAGGNLKKTLDIYKQGSDAAAENAKNVANLNPQRVLTGYKEVKSSVLDNQGNPIIQKIPQYADIKGPIQLPNAVDLADKYLKTIDENYGEKSTADMMGLVSDAQKPLIRAALDVVKYRNTPIPFEAAWDMKKAAGEAGFNKIKIVATPKQGQFATLTDAIDSDIQDSLPKWQNGGQTALNSFSKAKELVNRRHELYQQGDEISAILEKQKVSTSQPAFDAILSDPKKIGRAIEAAGPGGRAELQTYQIQKAIQGNEDWTDPNKRAVLKKLFNGPQLDGLDNFFEAAKNVNDKESNAGKVAVAIRVGHAALTVSGALLSGTGHLGTGASVLTGAIALPQFVKSVLLNPTRARAATVLMNLPPSSPQAKFWSRQVFAGLEGVGIALQMSDGKTKKGTITSNGVKID